MAVIVKLVVLWVEHAYSSILGYCDKMPTGLRILNFCQPTRRHIPKDNTPTTDYLKISASFQEDFLSLSLYI
jgi:hypothetical protein